MEIFEKSGELTTIQTVIRNADEYSEKVFSKYLSSDWKAKWTFYKIREILTIAMWKILQYWQNLQLAITRKIFITKITNGYNPAPKSPPLSIHACQRCRRVWVPFSVPFLLSIRICQVTSLQSASRIGTGIPRRGLDQNYKPGGGAIPSHIFWKFRWLVRQCKGLHCVKSAHHFPPSLSTLYRFLGTKHFGEFL